MNDEYGQAQRRPSINGRIVIALIIAAIALISYCNNTQVNEITGEKQHVGITPEQEVGLGLQAVPEMVQQYGGEERGPNEQLVEEVGQRLVRSLKKHLGSHGDKVDVYQFDFHLLADPKTLNAFALPGGQVFITAALLEKLETEGELAGVLGHEIGHVIDRHGAQHIATSQLIQGLTGAAALATYDPNNPSSQQSAAVAAAIGQLVNLKYGRDDENKADYWAVKLTGMAGYDPRGMIHVMQILDEASASGSPPEFMSTHPNPGNRIEHIEEEIRQQYPEGIPSDWKK